MHQLTAYIITVERQTGILPLERGGGGGDDITATYKQLRASIIPSYLLLSKVRIGGCLCVRTSRYACLTSPGAILNSSLKHFFKDAKSQVLKFIFVSLLLYCYFCRAYFKYGNGNKLTQSRDYR
jgi:hypothetical protein